MSESFISICIPAYNRPDKLYWLLKTIDVSNTEEIEVVVSDDFSPKREEIKNVIEKFRTEAKYKIVYHQNEKNLGYDGNLKETVKAASGKWIIFMGDDDEFIPKALDKLVKFLKGNDELNYVLRYYEVIHNNGEIEQFRYYKGNKFFESGEATYEELFRKSVFISGFTIKREPILPYLVSDFDGGALIQIYWVAEIVLKHRSAYFDEPITRHVEDKNYRAKELMIDEESGDLVARKADLKRSLNFLSGFTKITKFIDEKYDFNSTRRIIIDLSKYSYPNLSIHRREGLRIFWEYIRGLNKLGFNITPYYYLYVFFLIIFGKKFCDYGITSLKKIIGNTPHL